MDGVGELGMRWRAAGVGALLALALAVLCQEATIDRFAGYEIGFDPYGVALIFPVRSRPKPCGPSRVLADRFAPMTDKMKSPAAKTGRRAPGARRCLAGAFGGFWSMGVAANAFFAVVAPSKVAKLIVVIVATGIGFVGGWIASGDADPWPADDLRNGPLGIAMVAAIFCGFGVAVVVAMAGLSHTWAAGVSGASTVVLIAFAFPPTMRRRPDRATDST